MSKLGIDFPSVIELKHIFSNLNLLQGESSFMTIKTGQKDDFEDLCGETPSLEIVMVKSFSLKFFLTFF
jgi:hypothetical protein